MVAASFLAEPRKTAFRRWSFYVHFYVGLIAGLLYTVVGITGSILVYIPELRVLEVPGHAIVQATGQRLPLDTLYGIVRSSRPNDSIESFTSANERDPFEQYPNIALNFRSYSPMPEHERIQTFIDPYSGRIIAQLNYDHRLLQKDYELHEKLLGGATGKKLNAWAAVLLIVVSLSGMVLWWRGRKHWRLGLQYRTAASWKRQTWDMHNLGGFFFFLPLLILSATGFYYSYEAQFAKTVSAITGGPAAIRIPKASVAGGPWRPLDEILHRAEAAAPDCPVNMFYFPRSAAGSFDLRVDCPYDPHKIGLSHVYVDPVTGRPNGVDRFYGAPTGVKIIRMMTPLHYGDFLGTTTRILWVIVGLVPAMLFFTSLLMWWNRSLSKQWRRRVA